MRTDLLRPHGRFGGQTTIVVGVFSDFSARVSEPPPQPDEPVPMPEPLPEPAPDPVPSPPRPDPIVLRPGARSTDDTGVGWTWMPSARPVGAVDVAGWEARWSAGRPSTRRT